MHDEIVIVGRIGKSYGIKGWVHIYSFTDPIENLLRYQPWLIADKHKNWRELVIDSTKPHGNGLVAKFNEISSPETAKAYVNLELGVKRSQLPKLEHNEYYWHDLVGLTVINQQGETLGKVSQMLATGANDVMVVDGEKEYLIPFLFDRFVINVDQAKKQITVDWDADF
jgi:16S rRNA processing protein RimM